MLNGVRAAQPIAHGIDPPALAFATGIARSDAPTVAYAAVYPLTMILRILTAQAMVVAFA